MEIYIIIVKHGIGNFKNFLEKHQLEDTAQQLIAEIKRKHNYDLDCSLDTPPKTLILRPTSASRGETDCEHGSTSFDVIDASSNGSLIINIFSDNAEHDQYKADMSLDNLQAPKNNADSIHELYARQSSHNTIDVIMHIHDLGSTSDYEHQAGSSALPSQATATASDLERVVPLKSTHDMSGNFQRQQIDNTFDHPRFTRNEHGHRKHKSATQPVIRLHAEPMYKSRSANDVQKNVDQNPLTSFESLSLAPSGKDSIIVNYTEMPNSMLQGEPLYRNHDELPVHSINATPQPTSTSTPIQNNKSGHSRIDDGKTVDSLLTEEKEDVRDTTVKIENENHSGNNMSVKHVKESTELDWQTIKKSLFRGDIGLRLRLLQALRWRLTKSNPSERDIHLLTYIKHDVLSIDAIPPYGQLFLESYYCPKKLPTPNPLQEEMARFINTLASLAMGRLYLERDESLLGVMLLPLLMGKLPDGVDINQLTREFTLATVQKLTLSNKMREVIIASGSVEWLIVYIESNHRLMSTYEAEYSIAMLTNLCINKEARNRCERLADRVVALIIALIDTPHKCCVAYTNPLLFSLLLTPVINEKAVAQGIGVKLKHLYNVYEDNPEWSAQLDDIISMHAKHEFCECDDATGDEVIQDQYSDDIEPELSLQEPIYEGATGEKLLANFQYRGDRELPAKPKSAVRVIEKLCTCKSRTGTSSSSRPKAASREHREVADVPIARQQQQQQQRVNKSDKYATKPSLRLVRSVSQQPAVEKPAKPLKSDVRRREQQQPQPPPPQKVTQYIVNCCYRMDYTNAMAAPPGEFIPHAFQPAAAEQRNDCTCYTRMKSFLGDYEMSDKFAKKRRAHQNQDHPSGEVMVECASCQHAMPSNAPRGTNKKAADVKSSVRGKVAERNARVLRLSEYHFMASDGVVQEIKTSKR